MDGTLDDTPGTGVPSSAGLTSMGRRLVPPEVREALSRRHPQFGRYVTVNELGRGGMGAVFKAWDSDLGRWVALKVMLSGSFAAAEERERFLREAQTGAQFAHPNIASVYEVGVANDQPFIAMQFIEGRTLHDLAKELNARKAAELVRDAAYALHHAHEHKVIHRDVKPQNLMVGKTGQVYVLDFGLARAVDVKSSLSVTGYAVGTPAYMSPEQARGDRNLRHSTDVYALGATLYYAVTHKRPFEGPNPHTIINAVISDLPVPPSQRAAHVPSDLEAIILKAMEKNPEKRYATARDFGDDLQRFILGEPIRARPPSPFVRLLHAAAKRKALSASVAVGLAGLVALAVTFAVLSAKGARDREAAAQQQARDREAALTKEKELLERAALRSRQDSEIAVIGSQIEAWTAVLHDPPQPLAPHFARLREYLAKLDAIKSDSPARWRFIGRAYELLGRLDEAEEAFGKAEAWNDRGRIRLRIFGRLRRMKEFIRDGALLEREEKRAAALRTGALADFGRSTEASLRFSVLEGKDVFADAYARAQGTLDADAWDLAADAALAAARPVPEQIQLREKALRIREADIDLVIKTAYTWRNKADTPWHDLDNSVPAVQNAEKYARIALLLNPDDRDALNALSWTLMGYYWIWFNTRDTSRMGGNEGVIQKLVEALGALRRGMGPGDVGIAFAICEIMLRIPMVQVETRIDPTPATRAYLEESGRYMKEFPGFKIVMDRAYAWVLLAQGELNWRTKDAAKIVEFARSCEAECDGTSQGQEFAHYYPGLCWFYAGVAGQSADHLQKAVVHFSNAIDSQKEAHRLAFSHRGRAWFMLGNFAQAVRDFEKGGLPQDRDILEDARRRAGQ
jgi:tetratricopeptide (TPR) repeat protein/predicted Ser/Thr protein kinase